MIRTFHRLLGAGCVAAALIGGARTAVAADCSTLPSPTYIVGSSAMKPFAKELGKALSGTVTVVYQSKGSCVGVDAAINGTAMTGTASVFDATGAESSCTLPTAGQAADLGVSDVFATSCTGVTALPDSVGDFFGPNQVMNFIVPSASSQKSISAEAAYFVFGWGSTGEVDPWSDETLLFRRNDTSGTQQMIARAINVPASKWKGVDSGKSSYLLTKVVSSTSPEKTIGILASDLADVNRDKINILAFKAFGQSCGYYPDSTATAFDKINVRDGHYPIWGPLHFFTKIDAATKKPVGDMAKAFVGYFDGSTALPAGANLLDVEIKSHTVPACAMKVQRTSELGPLASFAPTEPCGCYFDKLANGATTCAACTDDASCTGSSKHCRHGYCEAN